MNALAVWVQLPVAQAIGWALVHFLWEGLALAAVLAAVLYLLRPSSARARYGAACATLFAMPLAFAVTLFAMWPHAAGNVPLLPRPPAAHFAVVPLAPPAPPPSDFTAARMLPWIACCWFLGVAFFYLRGLAAWFAARRLRHRGTCAPPPVWEQRVSALCARMRISRPARLLESCFIDAPVLVGYLRPVILMPLGCLANLPAGQIECILIHELSHIRRHDYLVNLLQGVVEGLLFYHPAVWWTSRTVREERENCCDDAVVALTGDARVYAATLATLEHRRAIGLETAIAATGGNLMKRIRRLLTQPQSAQRSATPAFAAGLLLITCMAALAAWPVKPVRVLFQQNAAPPAQRKSGKGATGDALATPYEKWVREDVAYIITSEERGAFYRLTSNQEREQFIEEFWRSRNPVSGSTVNQFREEHYRRIAYANEHFGTGEVAGWRTDRGRLYIQHGPPDSIEIPSDEERAAQAAAGHEVPSQSWRYRHIDNIGDNVVIDFIDPAMDGNLQMTRDPGPKPANPSSVRDSIDHAVRNNLPQAAAAPSSVAPIQSEPLTLLAQDQRQANQREPRQSLATPYRVWLNQDVAYIITNEERAAFLRLQSDQEREDFIKQFWIQRDPTPGTPENEYREEHYRRIEYSNEHFSTAAVPGWRTDRGRIYITYGPPDQITAEQLGIVSVQHWVYRYIAGIGANVALDFTDDGSGEYHMTKLPEQMVLDMQTPMPAPYTIRAGDILGIKVREDPKFNGSYSVSSTGEINLPLFGAVRAIGLSVPQLEAVLNQAILKYFAAAHASVQIENVAAR
jgi:GWxTD domain-containing protein